MSWKKVSNPFLSSFNLLPEFSMVPGETCADIPRTPSPAQSNGKEESKCDGGFQAAPYF